MAYKLLLYIHIFSAILSIGPFFVLLPMMRKLRNAKSEVEHAYLGIFKSAIRLVKHAGHVLVTSGVLLIILGSWSWATSWIVMTIFVMISSVFFLARAFSPTLKKFNDTDQHKELLVDKLHRGVWIYIALLMVMLWFMVAKPVLW